ncbi:MAG TPA: hypothetical protein VL133_05210 [Devosia sp.]|nr:hypothetical protein [Devosia sp.]
MTVIIPDQDRPGEVIEQVFTMTFRALPLDEAEAMDKEVAALPAPEQAKHQDDLLRKVARGWDDVVDGDGKPVPFTPDNLEFAMQQSWFRIGCYRAYRQSLQGQAAKAKN